MIEFQVWISQILGYCKLIADDKKMRQAWIERDFSATSVTEFDELYEQIFDDLDSDHFSQALHSHLPKDAVLVIARFIESLHEIDQLRSRSVQFRSSLAILDSPQWQLVRNAALSVLELEGFLLCHPRVQSNGN